MSLPNLPDTLKRGVGRRILGLFLLAGIVPVIFTAMLAYLEIGRGLQFEVNKTLRASAKEYGFDLLERLQSVSQEADDAAQAFTRPGNNAIEDHPHLFKRFESVWLVNADATITVVHGGLDARPAQSAMQSLRESGGDDGLVFARNKDEGKLYLGRALAADQSGSQLVFEVPDVAVWGIEEDKPFATDYCVFTVAGDSIHCTRDVGTGVHQAALTADAARSKAPAKWQFADEELLAATWQLFLVGEFGVPSLDIVAMQPAAYALRSGADFRRVFIPVLLLIIVLVGLLSFSLIGRSLLPLRQLSTAVSQLGRGNLESRLRIRSGDEFQWLGEAFNDMADRLGQQIRALEAMSDIDRVILSGAKFEEVGETVIRQLIEFTGCQASGVIARDNDSPQWAKMITYCNFEFRHERIPLPTELGHHWCQPRRVTLAEAEDAGAPYKRTFQEYGIKHAVLIPVVLDEDLKGILLLGSETPFNMQQESLLRCLDLAGRFAVALTSVQREEALYRQAHFDVLTGLPNRQLMKDRLEQQIAQARRDHYSGAMLYLDLDRFKEINDIYGHSVGDVVLTQAAERIMAEVRDSDTVARLGGDEFVVVLPRVDGDGLARMTATRLLERLTESFTVRGQDHFVGASIGVVMFPEDGISVETLLKNADAAMYRAKDAGRARFEFFSKELNAESRRKIGLERDLRGAFNDRKLEVFYQPQFDVRTKVISGAEALLRWDKGADGFISPEEFVPLAEDSELIIELGRWTLDQACKDLRRILDKGMHPGVISINVSARQLRDPSFVSDVLGPVRKHQIRPGYLQLEVTETTVAQNRDTAIEILEVLRSEGVRVAIDDFGTGYSSLSYLQQLPFDLLKIDKSFVDRIGQDDPSDNICRTIIRMADEMGRQSLAEGVERLSQFDFLKQSGCDFVQGFYFSEPLPMSAFVDFIEKQDFHTQRRRALEIVKS